MLIDPVTHADEPGDGIRSGPRAARCMRGLSMHAHELYTHVVFKSSSWPRHNDKAWGFRIALTRKEST
jgi:hypothetical protein